MVEIDGPDSVGRCHWWESACYAFLDWLKQPVACHFLHDWGPTHYESTTGLNILYQVVPATRIWRRCRRCRRVQSDYRANY